MKFFYASIWVITLACFASLPSNAQSGTHSQTSGSGSVCVSLRFTQSSSLNNYHPSNTYGTLQELDAIAWTISGTPTIWRSLLDFNFDTIPVGASISSATLALYGDSATNEPEGDSNLSGSDAWVIDRVTSAWTGSTVTWATLPTYTPVDSVQMPSSTSIYENFPSINVKSVVQDIVNNLPTEHGIMIKLSNENYYRSMVFCSNYYPNAARRPSLTICYRSTAGIDNITDNSVFSIYPNPTSSYLTVNYSANNNAEVNYKIYNALGMLIKKANLPGQGTQLSQTISTTNLPAGIYLFQLNDGKNILNKQFVKE